MKSVRGKSSRIYHSYESQESSAFHNDKAAEQKTSQMVGAFRSIQIQNSAHFKKEQRQNRCVEQKKRPHGRQKKIQAQHIENQLGRIAFGKHERNKRHASHNQRRE